MVGGEEAGNGVRLEHEGKRAVIQKEGLILIMVVIVAMWSLRRKPRMGVLLGEPFKV